MYYSSGNYEAFATPKKPEGIDNKSAYVVGTGLAGLAAACFLIRDAQMPGEHITLFEHLPVAGGSCDGIYDATKGFIMRGGRRGRLSRSGPSGVHGDALHPVTPAQP